MTLEEAVLKSKNFSEVMRNLGYKSKGGNTYLRIKKEIEDKRLDPSHFVISSATIPLEDIMIENSTYTNSTRLKERIIKENVLEYKCSLCGNLGEWNGIKLVLQLDHINGNNNDNRKENLRFLCPNCHSQTETYAGKNKNKNI